METVLEYIKNLDTGSYIIVIALLVILVMLYLFRKTPVVMNIILEAMEWVENEQNSEKGKAKRDLAIKIIRAKLPKILQFLITDSLLITIIEMVLNNGAKMFGVNKTIDIEGNESDVSVQVNENIASIKYESSPEVLEVSEDYDARLYGEVNASTDFHGNDNASIKVGIEKKF